MQHLSKLAVVFVVIRLATAQADIFQWEYVNAGDPGQGKQQSAILCVGGAGVDAAPGVNLNSRNLTMAYLIGKHLERAFLPAANLTNADLSHANLRNAIVHSATLTGANFTGAEVRGAAFTTLSSAKLYSTASYQAQDLTGIRLGNSNLNGWNFSSKILAGANFKGASLVATDLNQRTPHDCFPVRLIHQDIEHALDNL